jgi:hypothetical protein
MELNFIKIFGGGKTLVEVGLFVPDSVDHILLAIGPGDQSKEVVSSGLNHLLEEAAKDNRLIIAPVAPEGVLFHEGAEKFIPKMIEVFFTSMEQKPRKMSIIGIEEGQKSAVKIKELYPELFL